MRSATDLKTRMQSARWQLVAFFMKSGGKELDKSGHRLLNTINDIIEISKIEAGEPKVRYANVNVGEVMKFHYDFFLSQAVEKGLEM